MNVLQTLLGALLGGVAVGLWAWWASRQAGQAQAAGLGRVAQQDVAAVQTAQISVQAATAQQLEGQQKADAQHEQAVETVARQQGRLDSLGARPDALADAAQQAFGDAKP